MARRIHILCVFDKPIVCLPSGWEPGLFVGYAQHCCRVISEVVKLGMYSIRGTLKCASSGFSGKADSAGANDEVSDVLPELLNYDVKSFVEERALCERYCFGVHREAKKNIIYLGSMEELE